MRVSVEWINSLLATKLAARQMAEAMESAAIEVEEITTGGDFDERLVVGEVIEVADHPNADKLKVTRVDTGGNEILDIVCGAPNVDASQKVVVAKVGANLPNGMGIRRSRIRGVESNGMLCSEAELGISDNHKSIIVLEEKAKIGTKIIDLFTTNEVIDVKTPANRWDLNSAVGIAREVAAQTNQKLLHDYPEQKIDSKPAEGKDLIKEKGLATSYVVAHLSVDMNTKSPKWLTQRLTECGIRPLNVVVDITNYCMLLYGQPLHAFDASKVDGGLSVRKAKRGEVLTTLDRVQRKLSPEDIVIEDHSKVVGFAGVMGGANSEIDDNTQEIYLEAASFHPASIRKTAIRHGLRTDASARFERGLPEQLQLAALGGEGTNNKGAIDLLVELAGANLKLVTSWSHQHQLKSVTIDSSRIERLLGIAVSSRQIADELKKLSFKADQTSGNEVRVTVPWWRTDVTMEADMAEEIIKLIGFDKLPATIPKWKPSAIKFDRDWNDLWRAKSGLLSLGLFEVSTYSFISSKQIEGVGWDLSQHLKLMNPISKEQAYLRSSLFPSLLATASRNRHYSNSFGMFEFSKLFHKTTKGKLPHESPYLGVIIVKPKYAYQAVKAVLDRLVNEFNVEANVEPFIFDPKIAHPSRAAEIVIHGERRGIIGQLNPQLISEHKIDGEVGYLELDWEAFVKSQRIKQARARSRFPAITRDISVLIDSGIGWSMIKKQLSSYKVEFIGDYYGKGIPQGKKSVTLRFTFVLPDKTLTDNEADSMTDKALDLLKKHFDAKAR